MPIKKDRDLQYFFNPMTGYVSIDIFVQAEKIREMVVPDDPAVSEWGTYMSMLTQELSSVPVVTQSMGPSDYAGTSSHAGPSVSNEQDDEPEADSFLNNEHVDSEPDEVEVEGLTTNNPENNDEVSIEVMIDVLGILQVAMHPEVPADSIDIPTGAWGNFYDSNTGELAIGMVFKTDWLQLDAKRDIPVEHGLIQNYQKLNPGTVVEWLNLDTDRPGVQMLHYVFWAFRPCIEGFRCCRNVISVDGTHLYTKYKHKLLVAVTLDANQQDLCWRAGAEVNARKFERIMTEIRELNEEAYNWLGMIDKTQWTLSHDSGWRTGILTTNMSECVNGVLKGARRLPIVAIVQITFHRVSHTYVVKLKHKTCSCGKWGTHGIPCSHAIQVSRHFGVNASNFIPQYYSIRAYRKTYQGRFEPLYGEEYWDPVDIELVHNPAVEFAEDQADMFRRGYQMKWIDHKHVLANINLVKFRINVITL
ncbi:UNVERIFIED_CONTAM: hypothetical protein Scaly_3035800 [Sesamum calycinum]|uniref:SWIM-type domain-containing protein n=1 Tax=Sesamum calycinum TaxID=2727403 RepID=A0AAW2K7G3_9LAMI